MIAKNAFPPILSWALGACLLASVASKACADGAVMPKTLLDSDPARAQGQLVPSFGAEAQVSAKASSSGFDMHIKKGDAPWPGIVLNPADGKPWNLVLHGHVEAKVTNTGDAETVINLRVDNAGPSSENRWNAEMKKLSPGQSAVIRVYFGYSYNFQRGFKLDPEAVTRLLFFCTKPDRDVSFRIEDIKAAGWAGEPVGINPDEVRIKPDGGVLFGAGKPAKDAIRLHANGGAKAAVSPSGATALVDFADAGEKTSVQIKPNRGSFWDLGDHMRVVVRLRNTGTTPCAPGLFLGSIDGSTKVCSPAAPIAPGHEASVVIPFAPDVPWTAPNDPAQADPETGGHWDRLPGTGTAYRSHKTSSLTLLPDAERGAQSLEILGIVADQPPVRLPPWLGKRPPVPGDWVKTMSEEFDGRVLNDKIWNVYWFNWWDKRQHYSKDNTFLRDGKLVLRMEKKTGLHNDGTSVDIPGDTGNPESPYATGWADTFGKWTQRHGYFEFRLKLPEAAHMWPAVWMMPDRGLAKFPNGLPGRNWQEFKGRTDTFNGGMEIDIMESQSIWGPHRFNIACHWDGYGKEHKKLGTSAIYVETDSEGFIVVGLLWLPGSLSVYGNGREIWKWESPRIVGEQMYVQFQNTLGGWETDPLDDDQLPADFEIDYMRVWQRADLATPDDGPKPNKGGLDGRRVDGATPASPHSANHRNFGSIWLRCFMCCSVLRLRCPGGSRR
ncbi:MAG: glycoside hydrolase family 16 protein [Kiritimatiellia bacterium]|jgi:beta-glucanase (GH16 family)